MIKSGKLKKFFEKYYPFFVMIIFALITLFIALIRIPFWDEAHQIDIARLSFLEIFKITRVIGHPALWYLIIKPFSNPDLYPYPVLILNLTFCICALTVLWREAPFNYLVKTFITFSTPFLFYFAPVARCYSIGLIFLFLLCAYYPKKEKHPYIFSFLIVIGANTSEMVMVGCFYLGLIFIFDLYKNKSKDLKNVLIIFLLCALIIIAQFISTKAPFEISRGYVLRRIVRFVIVPMGATIYSFLLHLFSSIMFYIFPIYCFKKSKKALFFISSIFLTFTYIFLFVYTGCYWNHYFYYIYFIMTFWIFYEKLYDNKFIKTLFCLILLMFCFRSALFDDLYEFAHSSNSKEIARVISEYKDKKIYVLDAWSDITPGADVFLMKKNIVLYDIHNRKRTSYECLKNLYIMVSEEIDYDDFFEKLSGNSLIATTDDIRNFAHLANANVIKKDNDFVIQTNNNVYYLKNLVNRKDILLFIYEPINLISYGKINLWN